jgi:S-DNA-T family DNA segregation ATPase FtsK/SpoIIIE
VVEEEVVEEEEGVEEEVVAMTDDVGIVSEEKQATVEAVESAVDTEAPVPHGHDIPSSVVETNTSAPVVESVSDIATVEVVKETVVEQDKAPQEVMMEEVVEEEEIIEEEEEVVVEEEEIVEEEEVIEEEETA